MSIKKTFSCTTYSGPGGSKFWVRNFLREKEAASSLFVVPHPFYILQRLILINVSIFWGMLVSSAQTKQVWDINTTAGT